MRVWTIKSVGNVTFRPVVIPPRCTASIRNAALAKCRRWLAGNVYCLTCGSWNILLIISRNGWHLNTSKRQYRRNGTGEMVQKGSAFTFWRVGIGIAAARSAVCARSSACFTCSKWYRPSCIVNHCISTCIKTNVVAYRFELLLLEYREHPPVPVQEEIFNVAFNCSKSHV